MEWPNLRDPLRRLRIGLLSTDLRSHPVGYFLESVLSAIRADHRLECVAYASQLHNDAVSNRLKSLCLGGWHDVVNCSDAELAQRIHADGIDILLDLNGHTANNRLTVFAYRPAPVQVSWLGYFATTGLGAMDYLLADPLTLPPDLEPCFSEKIWRLPHTRLCFTPPELDLTVPPLPAIANGYITFGCFHSLSKINDAVLTLWANLMQAVPHSRLLLKARELDDIAARQSLISAFAVLGINPQRLDFEGQTPRADYLAAYGRIDILLDTFPYPGGTATVEALWMGVPVITMGGPSFLSRQGLGLLMNVGLPDWVATDANDYLARAVAHANAPDRLVVIRDGLRQRLLTSPLCDAPSFASDLSHALRGMWQRWCESKS
jgi:predicted O-linked N-acetylglucosamine transferase (SPINDLY family)